MTGPANRSKRGRFAPSPSGELHLGSARTALIAWLQIRQGGGSLVLRIEDLDQMRVKPGSEAQMLADLHWLGLDWDEGPDRGGAYQPYRQSERTHLYRAALEKLRQQGELFFCSCSRAELARLASAPHIGEDSSRYPGRCRTRQLTGGKYATRFRVPPGRISFQDGIQGAVSQDIDAEVGDFVVARADGVFAYQLAVVVDDMAMDISHVVRGDDLLMSTPRQLLLYQSLGGSAPNFFHVPLLLGPTGERLAKRDGVISIAALRRAGVTADRMIGYLSWTLGLNPHNQDRTADSLIKDFAIELVDRSPVRYNPNDLYSRGKT